MPVGQPRTLMTYAAWLSLLIFLVMMFQFLIRDKQAPNRDLQVSQSSEVVLKRNSQGHYVAPGLINGHPVTFLLDTGATNVSVPGSLADTIGLRPGVAGRARTASGVVTIYSTRLESVQLGGIELNNIAANINPHMPGETVLLGMSFMRQLELTQRGDTLTLRL